MLPAQYIGTVGLFLCPYRNLTTLTAATLALHPNVQVMNHGLRRLVEVDALEFLVRPSPVALSRFCERLAEMSAGGLRGNYGGSITFSHAFDHEEMRRAYNDRFSGALVKSNIQSVLWKESGTLQALLWQENIDPISLVKVLPQLRFVSPIRNPLDHAKSLQRYYSGVIWGPVRHFLASTELHDVFHYILKAHKSFFELHQRAPQYFFYFFECDLGEYLIRRLGQFLEITADPEWVSTARSVLVSKARHERSCEDEFRAVLHAEHGRDPRFVQHMEKALE